jgi:hypothetical protein
MKWNSTCKILSKVPKHSKTKEKKLKLSLFLIWKIKTDSWFLVPFILSFPTLSSELLKNIMHIDLCMTECQKKLEKFNFLV